MNPRPTQASERTGKWLVCDPRSLACDVAYLALANRLRPLPQLSEIAAHHADRDVEHVHRLRVAIRRATAALETFGPFTDTKSTKRLVRTVRELRKAANLARDLDVLLARNQRSRSPDASTDYCDFLGVRRKKAQDHVIKAHERLVETGKLTRQIERELLATSRASQQYARHPARTFAAWARPFLATTLCDFIPLFPDDESSLDALHEFRIEAKHLRYTIELVACAFSPSLRTTVYPEIESLQNHLGRVNDHTVACRKLKAWCRKFDRSQRKTLRRELSREQQALETAVQEFTSAWNPRGRQRLERRLNAFQKKQRQSFNNESGA